MTSMPLPFSKEGLRIDARSLRRRRNPGGAIGSYTIEGQRLAPPVTTILDVIAKPALGPWYAKEERRYFLRPPCSRSSPRPGARDSGVRTGRPSGGGPVKRSPKPPIGKKQRRRRPIRHGCPTPAIEMGNSGGSWARMPAQHSDLPEAAGLGRRELEGTGARQREFEALGHRAGGMYCLECGYAGTLDLYARVKGVLDRPSTGRAARQSNPEAFLQKPRLPPCCDGAPGSPPPRASIVRLPEAAQ